MPENKHLTMATLFHNLSRELKQSLFDRGQFRADLTLSSNPLLAYKKSLREAHNTLNRWFDEKRDITVLVNARAWYIDQLLSLAWEHYSWNKTEAIALLAVGGYGRGELHPGSDIDILILLERDNYKVHQPHIEAFLTLLWDIGLKLGSSVRSVEEAVEQARSDLSIITNLIESRSVAGPAYLYQQLQKGIGTEHMWPSKQYLQAKFEEQRRRHHKYNDTEYNLEPNIKGSPGNLRDLHMLGWITHRHFGTHDPAGLVMSGFLTKGEYRLFIKCRSFLWKIRWALHTQQNRCEDRLLFEYQKSLARQFNFRDNRRALAVEQFMQRYFRTVMAVTQLNDMLLQHFDDGVLNASGVSKVVPINERFQIRNHYIETRHPDVFLEYPPAILEIFVLMTRDPEILGARAETIRQLRDHRHLVDKAFQRDPRCTRLFLELMHAPFNMTVTLRRMARYGILGRYLPEFNRVIGQMQFDLFHTYTVDAHTLLLIKYLQNFSNKDQAQKFPVATRILKTLPKPRLLYIAGLFHDIGKGRGGDHSQLGAIDAEKFCQRHGLDNEDTLLVTWLVKEHLTMSTTAQRMDISDLEVIHTFAEKVASPERLDYLYTLTVADINATNPLLWNDWRASLLQQLYNHTRYFLKQGINQLPSRAGQVIAIKEKTMLLLTERGITRDQADGLWDQMALSYFICHEPEELAWQLAGILTHDKANPLIIIRENNSTEEHGGGSKIFIYTSNQPNLFAATVAALDHLHLLIQDARIFTSHGDYGLDTFTVLERDGSAIGENHQRIDQIQHHLEKVLTSPRCFPDLIRRRTPRQLKYFSREPEVILSHHISSREIVLNITATDRPGLLAIIGKAFMMLGLQVERAKIATFGETVEDHFVITKKAGKAFLDPRYCRAICSKLTKVLKQATARER